MAIEIVFQDGTSFRPLFADIDTEQRHALSAIVTEFPVERSADRSDHYRGKPDDFSCDVVFTDSPVTAGPTDELTRRRDAWALLTEARDRALPAVITTGLRTYDDMMLAEAHTTKTARDGTILRATLQFKQMPVFDTALVDDPTTHTRARDVQQVDEGTQGTTATTPQTESLASQLGDLLGLT